MSDLVTKPKTTVRPKTAPRTKRPPPHKVILLNDDFTPRAFVVVVLKTFFGLDEAQACKVMMTARRRGARGAPPRAARKCLRSQRHRQPMADPSRRALGPPQNEVCI